MGERGGTRPQRAVGGEEWMTSVWEGRETGLHWFARMWVLVAAAAAVVEAGEEP